MRRFPPSDIWIITTAINHELRSVHPCRNSRLHAWRSREIALRAPMSWLSEGQIMPNTPARSGFGASSG